MKALGPYSGVATSLLEISDYKKMRFVQLVINSDKHSSYTIKNYYWKLNEKSIPFEEKKTDPIVKF